MRRSITQSSGAKLRPNVHANVSIETVYNEQSNKKYIVQQLENEEDDENDGFFNGESVFNSPNTQKMIDGKILNSRTAVTALKQGRIPNENENPTTFLGKKSQKLASRSIIRYIIMNSFD